MITWKNLVFANESLESEFNRSLLNKLDFGLVKPVQIQAQLFDKTVEIAINMSNGDTLTYAYQERPENGIVDTNQFILNTRVYDFEDMDEEEYKALNITPEQNTYDVIIQLYTEDLKQRLSRRNWG